MSPSTRKTYEDRIANPNTPDRLRAFYKKLLREPDALGKARGEVPFAFVHFLENIASEK